MSGDANWAEARRATAIASASRERVAIEEASSKLLVACTGLPLDRLTAIMGEVLHRRRLFEYLNRTTSRSWVGSPERRAIESVYADVISGRL